MTTRIAALLVGLIGCGGGLATLGGAHGSDAGTGSSADAGAADAGAPSCAQTCQAPRACSPAERCLLPGACVDALDCAEGFTCSNDGGVCVPGGACGSTHVDSLRVPPNLIIALDRSCSMRQVVNGVTKWRSAVTAISALTTAYEGQLRFGLTLFPDIDANACSQGPIPIPIGDAREAPIRALLTSALDAGDPLYPDYPCVTNIDTGVAQAASDPGLHDSSHPAYLVLITDGKQGGCNKDAGNDDTLASIRELHDGGVHTFVVGFNSPTGIDVPALNAFAKAGGEVAPGAADGGFKFFNAQNQADLEAVLSVIGERTVSCEYALGSAPPDPGKLFVFFNEALVSGWSYDAAHQRVVFDGALCDELRAGQVMKLDIVYGCAGVN